MSSVLNSVELCKKSILDNAYLNEELKPSSKKTGVFVFLFNASLSFQKIALKKYLSKNQIKELKNNSKPICFFSGPDENSSLFIWVIQPHLLKSSPPLELSIYGKSRNLSGEAFRFTQEHHFIEHLHLEFCGHSPEGVKGALVGLDMANYSYKKTFVSKPGKQSMFQKKSSQETEKSFTLSLKKSFQKNQSFKETEIRGIKALSSGVNLARHLVNLPPNLLNPNSYSQIVKKLFSPFSNVHVDIWDTPRLRKEKMNLLLSVGGGAIHPPCFVSLKIKGGTQKPIIFVGKGITFDSGGVNLKPSSAMRLMKKDMGGSSSLMGLCYWAASMKIKKNLHFYLALAENSVSSKAYRPSDVLLSRSGQRVEVEDTDAEGRLVLADALNVALSEKPKCIVDVATLTGSIKAGLGLKIAGLFTNSSQLENQLRKSSQKTGEPIWPMPLFQEYRKQMESPFSDITSCLISRGLGGGAIAAALFLESFVGSAPWAHLDIYAWNNVAYGPYSEIGGSGQMVQLLSEFLKQM